MCWCFAESNIIVVTALACANGVAMVEPGASPGINSVAIIAEIITGYMLRVFACGSAAVMAQATFQRSAFELARKMTTGAIDVLMLAC